MSARGRGAWPGARVVVVLGLLATSLGRPLRAQDALRACDELFTRAPQDYDSSFCYYQAALRPGLAGAAARRLDELIARHPDNFWPLLTRGHLELQARPEQAETFYRRAAQGFARQGLALGEIAARHNLRTLFHRKGRAAEAAREVARVVAVAEASGAPELLAQARTLEALHLVETTGDLAHAYRALRRAEAVTFPDGAYRLRRTILLGLGNVCFAMGRFDEAATAYRRLTVLTHAQADTLNEATAWYNVANTRLRQLEERPQRGGMEQVRVAAAQALQAARASGNHDVETMALRTLGEALGALGDERAAHDALTQCLAVARRLGQARETSACLWAMSLDVGRHDARRATGLAEAALRAALDSGDVTSAALALRARMRVSWLARTPRQALGDTRDALRAVEALRARQPEGASAARLFSAWASDYHWSAGRLLLEHERGDASALAPAFEFVERLRARALVDALDAAGARLPDEVAPAALARHRRAQAAVVTVQRRLLETASRASQREALLAQLERAEDDEAEARRALRPRASSAGPAAFPALEDVRAHLRPDEALLSFQVALWTDAHGAFGGGAWLLASTRAGTRVLRLPDRARLEPAVALFLGLVERRDGSELRAAARLHAELLGPALEALPAGVRRLLIVPDGVLHRLPWAALRDARGRPLAARYTVSVVPSAGLWLRWRRAPTPPLAPAVLALADPERAGADAARVAQQRAFLLASDLAPGRLPHARREGRAALRALGGHSRLLTGRQASERALQQALDARYGVLHVAAHALVDDERPERSALWLAPGADDEDGLLQWREIAALPLAGRLVVLSACRSAGGALLQGEGVLGLARAFFEAGATTVVGGLWPLRDDETADVLQRFYRHLRAGQSVADALRAGQDEAARAGAPAAAWAGLVVLGDGSVTLAPPPVRDDGPLALLCAAALALIARAALLARRAAAL